MKAVAVSSALCLAAAQPLMKAEAGPWTNGPSSNPFFAPHFPPHFPGNVAWRNYLKYSPDDSYFFDTESGLPTVVEKFDRQLSRAQKFEMSEKPWAKKFDKLKVADKLKMEERDRQLWVEGADPEERELRGQPKWLERTWKKVKAKWNEMTMKDRQLHPMEEKLMYVDPVDPNQEMPFPRPFPGRSRPCKRGRFPCSPVPPLKADRSLGVHSSKPPQAMRNSVEIPAFQMLTSQQYNDLAANDQQEHSQQESSVQDAAPVDPKAPGALVPEVTGDGLASASGMRNLGSKLKKEKEMTGRILMDGENKWGPTALESNDTLLNDSRAKLRNNRRDSEKDVEEVVAK